MIKFFRHIRQKLLSESKFSKYLLYAIGEIVLVVIGILLALQINSWKVSSDNKKVERSILINIKKDLEADIKNLKNVTLFKAEQKEACTRLLHFITNPSNSVIDTIQFGNDVVHTIYFILPSANITGFETAKSNGNLSLIQNDGLIKFITKYYSDITLDQHVTETKRFTNYFTESVLMKKYPIFSKHIMVLNGIGGEYQLDLYKSDVKTWFPIDAFRSDFEVENHLIAFLIRLNIGINYLNDKEQSAEQLINMINLDVAQL